MAPGVSILAASIPAVDIGAVPEGKKPSDFAIKSGTSMACPHVAGAAAFVRSAHPRWSPSMIRSALMTTGNIQEVKSDSSMIFRILDICIHLILVVEWIKKLNTKHLGS